PVDRQPLGWLLGLRISHRHSRHQAHRQCGREQLHAGYSPWPLSLLPKDRSIRPPRLSRTALSGVNMAAKSRGRAWIRSAILAISVATGVVSMAKAQSPFPDPQSFLPPAPAWHGASEKLIVGKQDPWVTPTEKSDFAFTPTYAQ